MTFRVAVPAIKKPIMKLLYFKKQTTLFLGIQTEQGVFDIDAYQQSVGGKLYSHRNLDRQDLQEMSRIVGQRTGQPAFFLPEASLSFGTCTPYASKIVCIGLNYRKHALESGMAIPTVPVVFTKYNNTLVDFGGDVALGPVGQQFDYEVELGVVIGRKAKNVSAADALSYVLGYCVANDLSCRDLQFRTSQWLMGKSLDHFLPLGKQLVTYDEIPDPQRLELETWVNGDLRQRSNTADMVFSVAAIIEDLSRHFTLEPGDLILTGTPEGVAMGMKDQPWLRKGDKVEVAIEGLGSTVNTMI